MAKLLPVSRLIQVSVSLSQQGAVGRNFSELLVMGDSNVISGLERIRSYSSLAGIESDFGVDAPESKAAQVYYSQKPQPTHLSVGRWIRTATAGMLQGALLNATQSMLAVFTQITSGGFSVTINGVVHAITGLDFSTALNLNGVASAITSALSGAGTMVYNGSQFVLSSNTVGAGVAANGSISLSGLPSPGDTVTINGIVITFVAASPGVNEVLIGGSAQTTAVNLNTFLAASANANISQASYSVAGAVVSVVFKSVGVSGDSFTLAKSGANLAVSGANLSGGVNPSSVSFMTAPGSGQDVSAILGMTSAQALPLVPGYDPESALEAVVALDAISTSWYGLMFGASVMPDDSANIAIAGFIEADEVTRLFGVTIQNTNVLSAEVSNDLASELKALGYEQTFTQYSSSNINAVASVFGRFFTIDLNGQNTMIDMMYKQEPGVVAENLTTQQADTLKAKHCNVFVAYDNDTSIFQYSMTAGPAFIDEVYIIDALQNAVETSCFNVNFESTTKVPQTDAGTGQFVNAIAQVCQQFVQNGAGAPGQWNAAGFGQLQQGQFLKLGYYIFAPSVSSQSESDRAARKSVPIQVAFKLAGSIQTVDVLVTVNQ